MAEMSSTADFQSNLQAVIDAYRERWANPPKPAPLLVPSWFPASWARAHPNDDLAEVCRAYGFDGYQTPVLPRFTLEGDLG